METKPKPRRAAPAKPADQPPAAAEVTYDFCAETVSLAYDQAMASYGLAERRLDTAEKRLQDILTAGVTASVAIAAVLVKTGGEFYRWQFVLAAIVFVVAVTVGGYGRLGGHLEVIMPDALYAEYMELDESRFRRYMIYFAGEAHKQNIDLIAWKNRMAGITGALFVLALLLLVSWAAASG